MLLAVFLTLLRGVGFFLLVLDFDFDALLLIFFLAGIAAVYHFAEEQIIFTTGIQRHRENPLEKNVRGFLCASVSQW